MRTTSYTQHSATVHEHRFEIPLDHRIPSGAGNPSIEIFAREVIRPGGEDLPHLVFMQGGPGSGGPRPGDFRSDWIGRALQDYRVVLLDQRGTGQSTWLDASAVDALVLRSRASSLLPTPLDEGDAPRGTGAPGSGAALVEGTGEAPTDAERARVLSLFRQDQIVWDAEVVRRELAGDRPWTSLGQSFGGFINTAYLSLAPEGLEAVLYTGGLPALTHVDGNYRLTYERTAARNRAYFARYPGDERTVREVAAHLRDTEELLPTGERLSPARFRSIGMGLGTTTAFDQLHYALEGPWARPVVSDGRGAGRGRRLSGAFLRDIGTRVAMEPLYGVLQEFIYACATPELMGTATNWSAERLAADLPGFRPDADPLDWSEPYFLTGEHMPRAFFAEDPALRPLAGATDVLAHTTDVSPVYLPEILRENSVPGAAAVYFDDMFVPRETSLDTAATIRGLRTWVTSEHQHDGLRASGGAVLDHLLGVLRD